MNFICPNILPHIKDIKNKKHHPGNALHFTCSMMMSGLKNEGRK